MDPTLPWWPARDRVLGLELGIWGFGLEFKFEGSAVSGFGGCGGGFKCKMLSVSGFWLAAVMFRSEAAEF